jgi:hypothetical protein
MTTATSSSVVKENSSKKSQKLTRVVSTKLSIEDDDLLQHITTLAYQNGDIKEPSKSEILRFFITLGLSAIKKEQPSSLLSQKQQQ